MLGLHEGVRVHLHSPLICRSITCKHSCFTVLGVTKHLGVTTFLCAMNEFQPSPWWKKIPRQLSCRICVNSERISVFINGIQKESVRFQFIPDDDNPLVLSVSLLKAQFQVVLFYCIRFLRRYGQTFFLLQKKCILFWKIKQFEIFTGDRQW